MTTRRQFIKTLAAIGALPLAVPKQADSDTIDFTKYGCYYQDQYGRLWFTESQGKWQCLPPVRWMTKEEVEEMYGIKEGK
jgi:hypothetical protein